VHISHYRELIITALCYQTAIIRTTNCDTSGRFLLLLVKTNKLLRKRGRHIAYQKGFLPWEINSHKNFVSPLFLANTYPNLQPLLVKFVIFLTAKTVSAEIIFMFMRHTHCPPVTGIRTTTSLSWNYSRLTYEISCTICLPSSLLRLFLYSYWNNTLCHVCNHKNDSIHTDRLTIWMEDKQYQT
jgi:hypothetical protein